MLMADFVGTPFRYSSILDKSSYRSAHDPPFEKGSFSVLILENHTKTQISLRESIYERGVLGCLRFYCAIQQLKNLTGFYAY